MNVLQTKPIESVTIDFEIAEQNRVEKELDRQQEEDEKAEALAREREDKLYRMTMGK
jgi:hypothetical protein